MTLRGAKKKVELARTRTQERECERLFYALGWTPEGRRARGRPKTTWRRTAEKREIRPGGRAGMWPRRRLATENVGWTMCRPHAPTGAVSHDDDDDDYACRNADFEILYRPPLMILIFKQSIH